MGQWDSVGQMGQLNILLMIKKNANYQYQLDKSSRKYICPQCQHKTFTLYIDEYGQALNEEVGRCDRQDKCRYHYSPREYFKDHETLDKTYRKNRRRTSSNHIRIVEPSFISPDVFIPTIGKYECNSLMHFLHSVFDSKIGSAMVDEIAVGYGVGTSKMFGGSPVFWQVDECGRIRSGKIMGYNPYSGKRIKEPENQVDWVHNITLISENKKQFNLQQCCFGCHRLITVEKRFKAIREECRQANISNDVSPIVALFESEKACLIVAMVLMWLGSPDLLVPVASGGCQNFSVKDDSKRDPYHKIQVLKNRKVVIFPDEGKYDEWREKAMGLKNFSSEVYVSTIMERDIHEYPVECEIEEGDALDDILLRYIGMNVSPDKIARLILTSYKDKLF